MTGMDPRYLEEREEFLALAYRKIEEGACEDALRLARERAGRHPGDVDAWLVIAAALTRMGEFDEAAQVLAELEAIVPGRHRIHECRGDLYARQGKIKDALQCYRQAVTLESSEAERIAEKIERIEKSAAPAKPKGGGEAAIPPSDFQTITMADLYIRQGHLSEARAVITKILEREPSNMAARERLTTIKSLLKENEETPVVNELSRWMDKLKKKP